MNMIEKQSGKKKKMKKEQGRKNRKNFSGSSGTGDKRPSPLKVPQTIAQAPLDQQRWVCALRSRSSILGAV